MCWCLRLVILKILCATVSAQSARICGDLNFFYSSMSSCLLFTRLAVSRSAVRLFLSSFPSQTRGPKRARPFWLPSPPLAVVKEDDSDRPSSQYWLKVQDDKGSCCFNQVEDETVWTTADATPHPPPLVSPIPFLVVLQNLRIVLQPQTACCIKTLNRLSHCCFMKTSLEIPRLHHGMKSTKVLRLKAADWTVAAAPSHTIDFKSGNHFQIG